MKKENDVKKTLFILVFALVLTVSLVSCSDKKEDDTLPDGMLMTENAAGDYSFFYPEEWIVDRNDGMVMVHVSESDASSVSVSSFAPPREGMTTLEDYLENGYVNHIKDSVANVEIDSENFTAATLSGRDARRIEFSATVGEKDFRFLQVITLNTDGYIYIVTYTSTPDFFETHLENVEKIITEFKFN